MKEIIITKDNINQRIDKFLAKEFFSYTRGEIIRQIKNGNILINGKIAKPSYILKENDKLKINFEKKSEELIPNKNIKIEIIYEDENIIAINKSAGISVHPARLSETNTLVNWLIHKFPETKSVGDDPKTRPGIVHRLDKDTSGVMLIAKNQKAYEELKDKFKNRGIEKKYLAIVYGKLEKKSGAIEKPIARSSNYKKQIIANRKTRTISRPALTEYKVVKEFDIYSLIEVTPKTGRMHQIRVHMKSIGHPILGDEKYRSKSVKGDNIAKRQMLHAERITFNLFGKNYVISAKIPQDFHEIIGFLTKTA